MEIENILIRFKCYLILTDCGGSPWGGGRWVDGGGGGYGCVGGCPMHTHMCMHAHTHTHTHMHVKHDQHGCLHVGGHLQFSIHVIHVHVCVCMHVCACACMWGHPSPCLQMPPDTPHPPAPSPELQGVQNTKFQ